MAKAKTIKQVLDKINGPLGRTDNTLGRNRGLALNMTDKTPDGTIKLGVKTAMPPGGSEARHAVVKIYCACDILYKLIDYFHKEHLCRWFRASRQTKDYSLTAYMIWIKICCLNLPEKEHFVRHAWYGRWSCSNDTDTDLVDWVVNLADVSPAPRTARDGVVVLVSPTYQQIDICEPQELTGTTLTFTLPLLPAHTQRWIDVYWLVNPPAGWPAP